MAVRIDLPASLNERVCAACGVLLVRRTREAPGHWASRRVCSVKCNGLLKRQNRSKRFWAKVAIAGENDCWPWLGRRTDRGYGEYHLSGERWRSHRFALADTGIELGEKIVLHKCDNPPCCNPKHLTVGTYADNNADMRAKGRAKASRGEAHHGSKLTENQVREIRASQESLPELARRFGLAKSAICNARSGKTWGHV